MCTRNWECWYLYVQLFIVFDEIIITKWITPNKKLWKNRRKSMASSVFFRLFGDFIFISEENEIFHGKFVMVKTHLRCKYTYIKFDTKIPNHSLPLTVSRSPSLHLLRDVWAPIFLSFTCVYYFDHGWNLWGPTWYFFGSVNGFHRLHHFITATTHHVTAKNTEHHTANGCLLACST